MSKDTKIATVAVLIFFTAITGVIAYAFRLDAQHATKQRKYGIIIDDSQLEGVNPNYRIVRFHDDANSVTCWADNRGLSCLPDKSFGKAY